METLPQTTRISQKEINERREKGLCSVCNSKWSKGHNCQETKLFNLENNEETEIDASTQMGKE